MDSAFKRHLRFTQLIVLDAQQPLKGSFRIKEETFWKTSVDLNDESKIHLSVRKDTHVQIVLWKCIVLFVTKTYVA